jgi:hypothetical protein
MSPSTGDRIDLQESANQGDDKPENYRNTVSVHCRFWCLINFPLSTIP